MLGAQSGYELLELGEQQLLLDATGATRFGPTEARMIGEEQGVPAVFFGHMIVSDVKPSASISGVPRVGIEVSVELTVRPPFHGVRRHDLERLIALDRGSLARWPSMAAFPRSARAIRPMRMESWWTSWSGK